MSASALAFVLAAASAPDGDRPVETGRPHAFDQAYDKRDAPLSVELVYSAEVMGNAHGGHRRGVRYLDNFDVVLGADLEALAGWRGATLGLHGLYNNGRSISDLTGDAQAVSNIETGVAAVRLYEAWVEQKMGDAASLRIGLYDLNTEFDALDAASLFVSSPHGIGTDFAQTGRNGPSIFPSTSLAARLEVKAAEGWMLRFAVLDGVPGDPAHPARTAIRLGNGDGALLVGEVQAPLGGGKLLLGHWHYSSSFDRIDGRGRARGNRGSYVRAELPIVDHPDRNVVAFARFGVASDRFNSFARFASAGLNFSGWLPGRRDDAFGIAVAAAFTGAPTRALTDASRAEVALEATYRARLSRRFSVQPSVHYIHRPSADPTLANALVLGLRGELSLNLFGG